MPDRKARQFWRLPWMFMLSGISPSGVPRPCVDVSSDKVVSLTSVAFARSANCEVSCGASGNGGTAEANMLRYPAYTWTFAVRALSCAIVWLSVESWVFSVPTWLLTVFSLLPSGDIHRSHHSAARRTTTATVMSTIGRFNALRFND